MSWSFSSLLGTAIAAVAGMTLVGCGARSVMEMGSYRHDGSDDGGTDASKDGPIDDGPVYDHSNDTNGCNPSTCGGCCDADGKCVPGMDTHACGIGGYDCVDCAEYNAGCNAGTHQCGPAEACSPSTCAGGCCNEQGACVPGSDTYECGSGGGACTDCSMNGMSCDPYGKYCTGQPACGPDNCGGCCSSWGTCEWGGDISACGWGGSQCQDCSWYGMQCDPNTYQCVSTQGCGPATCPYGCCDPYSGSCMGGFDSWACGSGGEVCQPCTDPNQLCNPSSAGGGICQPADPACGPYSCSGCCECPDPYGACKCVEGLDPVMCGNGGEVCQSCTGPGQTCEAVWAGGQCVMTQQTCDPSNCGGCCDYSTYPPQCVWGGDSWACGNSGNACSYCGSGETCEPTPWGGGQCTVGSDCGYWNCPGCCDYAVYPPQCLPGGDNWACGSGGASCSGCYNGTTCTPYPTGGGTCTDLPDGGVDCGPWNCNGCCNYSTWPPFCDPGVTTWSCGSMGQACSSCAPGGECILTPEGGGMCSPSIPDAGIADASGCGPWNCQGCCTQSGNCVPGQSDQRCGTSGEQCVNCVASGGKCAGGGCVYP